MPLFLFQPRGIPSRLSVAIGGSYLCILMFRIAAYLFERCVVEVVDEVGLLQDPLDFC